MTGGISGPALPPLSSSLGSGLALDTTLGAYLIGTFCSLPLYGLSVHQLYRYCRLFPKDTTYIRILVAIVMPLETMHAAALMHSCYYYLTTNYDNPNALLETPVWSVAVVPLLSTVVGLIAEIFFAWRVSMLGSWHKIIAIIAILCLLTQIGCSSVSVRQMYVTGTFEVSESKALDWVARIGYGFTALADILLSGCIIRALRRSRARHEQTDTLLDVFMLYVVNSGLLIGLCSTAAFVLTVADPNELRWASFNIITCRLSANTLLSVLNSRRLFISCGMEIFHGNLKALGRSIIARANELAKAERWDVPQVPDNSAAQIQVGVKTEVETDSSGGRPESEECPHLRMDLKFGGLLEDV
ncbi:uncharacterized protein TRAVEDRAFT_29858 [Trametes versicolor FP-101664 SS1]|uniref:uncharacterized protein n=1 Tax=Trametes versicolor (strain FP-101664) TaxID=717944 RepID=UPI0004622964|nr:uncharacterized protein TRAVEDRAFT_29858 [Trametes versicolor FP-101664 SS1]EIW57988.1 hypothetical protein TRAVEDRAFT_29858 [Trametes versicolor FP-101664 SS1]